MTQVSKTGRQAGRRAKASQHQREENGGPPHHTAIAFYNALGHNFPVIFRDFFLIYSLFLLVREENHCPQLSEQSERKTRKRRKPHFLACFGSGLRVEVRARVRLQGCCRGWVGLGLRPCLDPRKLRSARNPGETGNTPKPGRSILGHCTNTSTIKNKFLRRFGVKTSVETKGGYY